MDKTGATDAMGKMGAMAKIVPYFWMVARLTSIYREPTAAMGKTATTDNQPFVVFNPAIAPT
jgi:hypothetical protein